MTVMPDRYPPLVREVIAKADQAAAFRRFTEDIASWWPLATHSVGGAQARGVRFEPQLGGRIVESIDGDDDAVWGTVTRWEPPGRLAFTWHPGDVPDRAQDVELRFEPAAEGTRVILTHRGFERLGDDAAKAYRGYPIGWSYVLGLYAGRRDIGMRMLTLMTTLLMWVLRVTGRDRAGG